MMVRSVHKHVGGTMWGKKSATFVQAIRQAPSSIGQAGLKSLSGLASIAKGAPGAVGQVGSMAAAAVGRVARRGSAPTNDTTTRVSIGPQHPRQHVRIPRAMIMYGIVFVLVLATVLSDWMYESFRTYSIGGMLLSPIFMILLWSATFWLGRELRSWQRLTIVEQLQSDLSSACESAAEQDRFRSAFAQIRETVREPQFVRFLEGADLTENVAQLQDGLDRVGLQGMDTIATEAIRQGTRDIFFLSLVSANALGEVVVFGLRALGLIRRVASAYGYRPGRFGLLRLARHIFADIALLPVAMLVALEVGRETGSAIRNVTHAVDQLASAAHPLAGAAVGAIGSAVGAAAESVTPRVADATLAAGRMAHLGLLAAVIVRPITFSPARYGEMRNVVYKQILGLRMDAIRGRKRGSAELSNEPSAS
jgi:uncharacterized membrane protein YcjF (UPF0283 family)